MYAELRPGITAAPRDLWRIEILGGLKATRNGLEVRSFAARRVAALLARLALSPTRSVPREGLMDLFWGDMDVDAARHNLRQTLFSLRRALQVPGGSSVVRADHDNIWLDVSSVTTDVEEFEEASRRAKHRSRPEAIGDLTRAAEL